jgi:hypothetical protein
VIVNTTRCWKAKGEEEEDCQYLPCWLRPTNCVKPRKQIFTYLKWIAQHRRQTTLSKKVRLSASEVISRVKLIQAPIALLQSSLPSVHVISVLNITLSIMRFELKLSFLLRLGLSNLLFLSSVLPYYSSASFIVLVSAYSFKYIISVVTRTIRRREQAAVNCVLWNSCSTGSWKDVNRV